MDDWTLPILYNNDVWQFGVLYHDHPSRKMFKSEIDYRKLHDIHSVSECCANHKFLLIKFNSEEAMLKFQMTYL